MVDTVLAGPDGRTPAVDAVTGTPLTMEMMLRRRGILTANGGGSMMGLNIGASEQQPQQGSTGVGGSPPVAQADNVSGLGTIVGKGNAASGDVIPPRQPGAASADATPNNNEPAADAGDNDWLAWLAGLGVTGATAYALMRKMRGGAATAVGGNNGGSGSSGGTGGAVVRQGNQSFGADDIARAQPNKQTLLAQQAEDGSFRVIGEDPALQYNPQRDLAQNPARANARAMQAGTVQPNNASTVAAGGPGQTAIGENTARALARNKAAAAAEGTTGSGVIAADSPNPPRARKTQLTAAMLQRRAASDRRASEFNKATAARGAPNKEAQMLASQVDVAPNEVAKAQQLAKALRAARFR